VYGWLDRWGLLMVAYGLLLWFPVSAAPAQPIRVLVLVSP
jgi:hypothetical protein